MGAIAREADGFRFGTDQPTAQRNDDVGVLYRHKIASYQLSRRANNLLAYAFRNRL